MQSLEEYSRLTDQELTARIEAVRKRMGKRLLILGHYYQKPEILALSDAQGDSFQLSARAAENQDCEVIVFCGVHFMAETADILANAPNRLAQRNEPIQVLIPDLSAGCPMADMAEAAEVENAWSALSEIIDTDDVIPITYVNSSAAIKSFCGKRGGYACTSSNAKKVLTRAQSEKKRVLFLPDQHLGRNTARDLGIPSDEVVLWQSENKTAVSETRRLAAEGFLTSSEKKANLLSDALAADSPLRKFGGNTPEAVQKARIILWNGFCPIHQEFLLSDLTAFQDRYPDGKIIVHPECRQEVVLAANHAGSTKLILDEVTKAPNGSIWGIGTERRMVDRLIADFPQQTILPLAERKPLCKTMDKITLAGLCRTLESIETDSPIYPVQVDETIAAGARLALLRMLECK